MITGYHKNGRIRQITAQTLDVNAYIIEQKDYLIVIDSLLLARDSEELKRIAISMHKPVRYLINTHFHSDHCLGNRHIKEEDTIQINHKTYWETIERERAMINPQRYKPVDKRRLTKADLVFEEDYELEDLILLATPGHSPDSICLYLPRERILISGDTVLSNSRSLYSLPYFFWGRIDDLIASQKRLLQFEIDYIYSGHGVPLSGKDKLKSDLNYLVCLRENYSRLKDKPRNSQQALDMIPLESCFPPELRIAVKKVHELNLKQLIE